MPDIIETEERIIDKPEVNTAQDDDYVLIDSETEGLRCITVKNLTGGVA